MQLSAKLRKSKLIRTSSDDGIFDTMKSNHMTSGRVPTQHALFESIRHLRYRQALLLVEAGVLIDARNSVGETPLIYAVIDIDDSKLRARFAHMLLEAGADPNVQDWQGLTALMHASRLGRLETVLILLEHPEIEMTLQDQKGNTALLHAAAGDNIDIVFHLLGAALKEFLSMAPVLQHKNLDGQTAREIATQKKYQETARLIVLAAQYPESCLDFDVDKNNNASINRLASNGLSSSNELPKQSEDFDDIFFENAELVSLDHDTTSQNCQGDLKVKKANSMLPLLSLSKIDVATSDPWDWDVGTNGVKSVQRKTITGSRSLNDAYDQIEEPTLQRQYSSTSNIHNFSSSTEKVKSSSFSKQRNSSLTIPAKSNLNLPPIKRNLKDYKSTVTKLQKGR